jgi:hypothetical protein
MDLQIVSLQLAHKNQSHLPNIQQDSFESLSGMSIHQYQIGFFGFH